MRGDVYNVGASAMNYTKAEVARAIKALQPFCLHEADVGEDLDKRNYEVSYPKSMRSAITRRSPSTGDPRDAARDPVHPAAVALANAG